MTETDDGYDAALNSHASYLLAVAALREKGVRAGIYAPRTDTERRQAAEGEVSHDKLDAVRHG